VAGKLELSNGKKKELEQAVHLSKKGGGGKRTGGGKDSHSAQGVKGEARINM